VIDASKGHLSRDRPLISDRHGVVDVCGADMCLRPEMLMCLRLGMHMSWRPGIDTTSTLSVFETRDELTFHMDRSLRQDMDRSLRLETSSLCRCFRLAHVLRQD